MYVVTLSAVHIVMYIVTLSAVHIVKHQMRKWWHLLLSSDLKWYKWGKTVYNNTWKPWFGTEQSINQDLCISYLVNGEKMYKGEKWGVGKL